MTSVSSSIARLLLTPEVNNVFGYRRFTCLLGYWITFLVDYCIDGQDFLNSANYTRGQIQNLHKKNKNTTFRIINSVTRLSLV